ncbi:MarR family transcriptional regulator [Paracrocinitomix mangrovi]|uniref:MarR family winged helix-turn-helix transcriptional regulator n=1 Tax=Paracrocinitomix mangrovi TaxID=2862509 RepID=UPI001C8D3D32|nr:MarR family transcriptional regulator [Paracrocinitomix mangrovi]UKN01750.1 MarR family transcriptional regulator [Paracrocinitomix mangrovi]
MKIEDELQSKFKNEYHKLAVNIHLTSSRLTEKFQEEMKRYDITSTQFNVLRILRGQNQKAVSIGLIKERMIERNSDVSRIIDRLVKKGLIERSENQIDRRQKDVRITDKGMDLLAEIDQNNTILEGRLTHLSAEEVKSLNDLLDKARSGCNAEQTA